MSGDFRVLVHIDPEFRRMHEEFLLSRSDAYGIYEYARDVVGGRWLEGEKKILESGDADAIYANGIYEYARDVVGGRWLEGEKKLLESGDTYIIYLYARYVIGKRWLEGEEKLLEIGGSEWWSDYYEYFGVGG